MNYQEAKARAEVLKAMAHPVRVLLVQALAGGDQRVSDLLPGVRLAQSNLSRHLATLKKVGIVSDRRVGPNVFYHLESPGILGACTCAVEVVQAEVRRRQSLLKHA